jgi:O-antigen ligase
MIAENPMTGIGPRNFVGEAHRFPHPPDFPRMEVHNTYLEIAASSGIPALLLYVALVVAAFRTCRRVEADTRGETDPRLAWFGAMARGCQASMASFLVSSTFGSLMHFDLMYHLCAVTVCLPVALRHERERAGPSAAGALAAAPARRARPAYSRYDRSPALATPVPPGLPDFRAAARK